MSYSSNNSKNQFEHFFIKFLNFFNNSVFIQYLLLILFTLFTFFLLRGHVLYRDDARPLLVATYNHSFFELFNAMRYDGAPSLHHFILWIIGKFIPLTPFVIKAFHLSIQILILLVLLLLIKIPNTFKLLILLQAPFIGHTIYVRRYTLAVLLILLFAYFYNTDKGNKPWIYIVLFLLSQTCPHGTLISVGLFLFLIINRYFEKKELFNKNYIIPVIGYLTCLPQIAPPKDFVINGICGIKPFFTDATLDFLILLLYNIFLNHFLIGAAFFYIIIFISFTTYQKKKIEVISFVICLLLIFTEYFMLGALKYPSLDRHNWLLSYTIVSFLIILASPVNKTLTKVTFSNCLLVILLVLSFYNFVSLIPKAKRLSSNGQNVALFLEKHYPEKETLAKYEFFIDSIIIYRKNFPEFFSLGRQQYVKYWISNHKSADFTHFKDLITILKYSDLIQDLLNTPDKLLEKEPIVILASHEYINDLNMPIEEIKIKGKYSLKLLKEFNGAKYDNYILYQIKKT